MELDERFETIRGHVARRHHCDWQDLELQIALLQAEVAELLRRVPNPDHTPATVTVTIR